MVIKKSIGDILSWNWEINPGSNEARLAVALDIIKNLKNSESGEC